MCRGAAIGAYSRCSLSRTTVGSALGDVRSAADARRVSDVHAALVVIAGSAANLFLAAMFVARVVAPGRARPLGIIGTAAAIPLAIASSEAGRLGLGTWQVLLPLAFVAFAIGEVVVDLILRLEFRRTRWLWLYLVAFYLAQWAVIGAAFLASRPGGFVVLATYFVCLAATAWSYRRVGHGPVPQAGSSVLRPSSRSREA